MFVADDLAAWLIGLLADAGHQKLTALILGDAQGVRCDKRPLLRCSPLPLR